MCLIDSGFDPSFLVTIWNVPVPSKLVQVDLYHFMLDLRRQLSIGTALEDFVALNLARCPFERFFQLCSRLAFYSNASQGGCVRRWTVVLLLKCYIGEASLIPILQNVSQLRFGWRLYSLLTRQSPYGVFWDFSGLLFPASIVGS